MKLEDGNQALTKSRAIAQRRKRLAGSGEWRGEPGRDPRLLVNILGVGKMPSWINPVEPHEIIDGKLYFLALKPVSHVGEWLFYSELKSGKRQFSKKPGIALKYKGSDDFRKAFDGRPDLCAVEVPSNAGSKWRARK